MDILKKQEPRQTIPELKAKLLRGTSKTAIREALKSKPKAKRQQEVSFIGNNGQ